MRGFPPPALVRRTWIVLLAAVAVANVRKTAAEVEQTPLADEDIAYFQCTWFVPHGVEPEAGTQTNSPGTVFEVDRLDHRDLNVSVLLSYVENARPLIVTGLVERWPAYHTWNLSWFVETHAEFGSLYDWGQQHASLTVDDYQQKVAENPRTYVAWVANTEDADKVNGMMREDLGEHPRFLPARREDERIVNWVYGGLPSAGAVTHRDAVCDGTWTAQFKGEKQWCFSTLPGLSNGSQVFYAATQLPGDMIIFTVPMWHGTHLLSESFSVHGYFPLTEATALTAKLESLSRNDTSIAEEYGHCFEVFRGGFDNQPDGLVDYVDALLTCAGMCLVLAITFCLARTWFMIGKTPKT